MEGLNLAVVEETASYKLQAASKKYLLSGKMIEEDNFLKLTNQGKLHADGIAADLFF
jgi:oxygen-independent coproporphyrinogen-3 oxidase